MVYKNIANSDHGKQKKINELDIKNHKKQRLYIRKVKQDIAFFKKFVSACVVFKRFEQYP